MSSCSCCFGAFMDRAGAGLYFLDLAFAMVGQYRGGPAKGAILASGMTGMVSGSSIANTVTTGTFTIPMMKRMGFFRGQGRRDRGRGLDQRPDHAADHGGCGLHHRRVRRHLVLRRDRARRPAGGDQLLRAVLHLAIWRRSKLGLAGVPKADLPLFKATLLSGLHYLIPIVVPDLPAGGRALVAGECCALFDPVDDGDHS